VPPSTIDSWAVGLCRMSWTAASAVQLTAQCEAGRAFATPGGRPDSDQGEAKALLVSTSTSVRGRPGHARGEKDGCCTSSLRGEQTHRCRWRPRSEHHVRVPLEPRGTCVDERAWTRNADPGASSLGRASPLKLATSLALHRPRGAGLVRDGGHCAADCSPARSTVLNPAHSALHTRAFPSHSLWHRHCS
jgi:hypothetical protein